MDGGWHATLGTAVLDDRAPVSWTVRDGVQPSVHAFTLDKDEAKKVKDGARVSLNVVQGPHRFSVRDLLVVGRGGTIDKFSETVLCADSRLLWRREWVRRTFNMRRRSGGRRRVTPDGEVPAAVEQRIDDVTYLAQTTKTPNASILVPYTAAEIARIVLDEVIGKGAWFGDLGSFPSKVVDNVEIDARGDVAISQVLALLPGADVFLGLDGVARIKNLLDVGEAATVLAQSGAEFVGGGHPAFVRLGSQRPFEIDVLFDVEQEVRFDFDTETTTSGIDERLMVNVIPVPDPTLKMVSGPLSGETVIAGTWVPMADYLSAINADKGGVDVPNLTEARIREFFLAPEWWLAVYVKYSQIAPTVLWSRRIGAIREHWRTTFRINRRWMNRIYSMRDYRVSVYDKETGTFGASVAYMDWCARASTKGLLARKFAQQKVAYNGNPTRMVNAQTSLNGVDVAPAVVSVIDGELGIISLQLRTDMFGNQGMVAPGRIDAGMALQANQSSVPITGDGSRYGSGGKVFSMNANFRASTIITVAPVSPNSTARLFPVTVNLERARKYLPSSVAIALPNATGPRWTMRIGAGLLTARFFWQHSAASQIEGEFGVGVQDPKPRTNERLLNFREIEDLARVTAAGLYASMPDKWEGSKSVPLNQGLLPLGSIRAVSHTLNPEGDAETTLDLPDNVAAFDALALMPRSTQNFIYRNVQPAK